MYVLKELYWGNISPTERTVRPGSNYKKASAQICKQLDCFLENLTPEERKQWEAISDLRNDMAAMAEEDAFIYGFRLGARMMLDVVGTTANSLQRRGNDPPTETFLKSSAKRILHLFTIHYYLLLPKNRPKVLVKSES